MIDGSDDSVRTRHGVVERREVVVVNSNGCVSGAVATSKFDAVYLTCQYIAGQ